MPPRGRGGKFSKPTRGGGKHFSKDLQPLDKDGNALGMWRDPADQIEESSEEEEEEEDSEEESSDDAGPSKAGAGGQELSREERRAAAKKKKEQAIAKKNAKGAAPGDLPPSDSEESDEDMPANPNHTAKARSQAAAGAVVPDATTKKANGDLSNLTRREREAIQAQQARERYQKLHSEGKTDEAKADLARLKLIREKREAEAARKAAEKEEREAREKANADEREAREAKLKAAAMGASADAKKGKAKPKK